MRRGVILLLCLAFVGCNDRDGGEVEMLSDVKAIEELELTSNSPQWMPDGTLTYFDRRQNEEGEWGDWQLTMFSDGEETDVDIDPVSPVWSEFTPDWPDCPEAWN